MAVAHPRDTAAEPGRPGPVIDLRAVTKVYRTGKLEYPALRGVDLAIDEGDMVAVVGPSETARPRS